MPFERPSSSNETERAAPASSAGTAAIQAADSYEIVEEYPEDKYFPSYLLLGRQGKEAFHVLFGTDVDGQNVRIITAYYPSPQEWEADLKTRRRSP